MIAFLTLALSLLFAASSIDVTVITIPKGDITVPLTPTGKAEMKRDGTITRIKIEFDRAAPPAAAGPAFSTYVVWAVSPEGIYENIGEILMDKDRGRLEATTRFEQVGLLITAEPHYMVDRPSSAVVFRNQTLRGEDVRRVNVPVEIGTYDYSKITTTAQTGLPLLVVEARTALQIAKIAEADRWAETEYRRARVALDTMEQMVSRASPFDIVAQSANETIRRSQQAVTAAREKKSAVALDNSRAEAASLMQQNQTLNSQLRQQQNSANSQIQKLQADLATAGRDTQRLIQERDQAVAGQQAVEKDLTDLKKKQSDFQERLVLPLKAEFYDIQASALSPAGREALMHLIGVAEAMPGQVRLDGPAPDALFEAAKQYLIQAGVSPDRIILKR